MSKFMYENGVLQQIWGIIVSHITTLSSIESQAVIMELQI